MATLPAGIKNNITQCIGNTPLVELQHVSPNPDSPWLPERTPAQRKLHEGIWKVAPKVLQQTFKADFKYLGPAVMKFGGSNAFRVLARKEA